jgi:hypothetical protein
MGAAVSGRIFKPAAITGLVISLAIVAGGIWMIRNADHALEFDAAAKAIHDGIDVPPSLLSRLSADAVVSNGQGALHGTALEDASIVTTAFALSPDLAPVLRPAVLISAEAVNRARVAEAPADSHAWMRIVMLHTARLGIDPFVLDALRMSRFTGPREFAVMWPSIRFRVEHWQQLPDEEKVAASDIAAGLWRRASRPDLIAYFKSLTPDMRAKLLERMSDSKAKAALLPVQ